MNQRTRYFLIASILTVGVGLGTGLVAYYNGGLGGSTAMADDFSYVPADATAVAYADVRSIMNSELRQRLKTMLPSGQEKDRLQEELGLDPERDIDTVVAGYTGTDAAEGGIVLVRGRFDADMIESKAVQHGARVETYRDRRILLMPVTIRPDAMPEGSPVTSTSSKPIVPGVAMLEPGLMAFGDADTLHRAIDASASRKDMTQNAELMRHVNEVRGLGNAWVVTKFDAVSAHAELPAEVRTNLPALQWLAMSANVNGGLRGTVRAEARDEKGAQDLQAVVNGGLAAARMMSNQDPRLEALVNSVQVMGSGTTVSLTFSLQPELLDLIAGAAHRGGGAPR